MSENGSSIFTPYHLMNTVETGILEPMLQGIFYHFFPLCGGFDRTIRLLTIGRERNIVNNSPFAVIGPIIF